MGLWEKNFAALEGANPRLAEKLAGCLVPEGHRVQPSRQGARYLMVGGQRLHSAYDPVKEGEEWARSHPEGDGEPPVVFGLGLGYHLLPWLAAGRPVRVVEPDLAVARLALEHQDLTALLSRDGLRIGRDFRDLPRPAEIVAYNPTRRLHPGLYRRLEDFLSGEDRTGHVRILVAAPMYGGSHPIARYSVRAFQALGHEAELLDYAPFHPGFKALQGLTRDRREADTLQQDWFKFLGQVMLSRVRDFRPDLLFLLAQVPVDPPLLRAVKAEVPLTAFWFVEDFQVFPYWREVAPEVDVFFSLQREPFSEELGRLGVTKHAFLPLAADPHVYRPIELSPGEGKLYGSALAFVGAGYANRRELFQGFMDFDFKIWGSEWNLNSPLGHFIQNQGARVSAEEAVKIFNASRINLNLHSSPFHRGINPAGDYLNPRVFDLAAAGAFQLVDWRAQLPEFFTPGREVATFASLPEAREKIDHFLAHAEERREVARRGRERCLREHTYELRLAEALEIIEDLHPGVLPKRKPRERPLAELNRLFPPEHPAREVIERARATGKEDLGDLVAEIKEGEAPLSEAEAILWLLSEFQQGLNRRRF